MLRKRIEVIADDEDEMWVSVRTGSPNAADIMPISIEAARRMTEKYDFVITSGGIGPTHDGKYMLIVRTYTCNASLYVLDITYASLAKAFNLPLVHHPETLRRMWALTTPERRAELEKATPAQREARERMALFPTQIEEEDVRSEAIFVEAGKWVPVVRLAGKVSNETDLTVLHWQLINST